MKKALFIGAIALIAIITVGAFIIFQNSNDLGSTRIMEIGPEKVDCVGVGPRECLVVDGEYFYSVIGGFEYEEGYTYSIKVGVEDVENPPADGSSLKYTLIKIISKEKI